MKVSLAVVALTLATASLAEQRPDPPESRSDLLWQKLDSRVGEIVSQFDGVTGLAILDLTDSQYLERIVPLEGAASIAQLIHYETRGQPPSRKATASQGGRRT